MNCDTCINDIETDKKLIDYMIIKPIHFSSKYFITKYYNILNLNDLLEWIQNNTDLPYQTKKRVFEHGMIIYGSKLNIFDNRLLIFIKSIFNNNIMQIYNNINKYIIVKNESISITNIKQQHIDTDIDNIVYYIKTIILSDKNINLFTIKFIKYYNSILNQPDLVQNILNKFIEYTKKKIKITSQ